MPTLHPTSARIQSSLQQPTDQWEAAFPGDAEYVNMDPARTVDIEIGLLDAAGEPQTLRAITGGVVDEYRLEVLTNGVVSHLKGRDAGAVLLDTEFKTLYQRFPGQDVATPADVTIEVGVFRAKQVAEAIISSAGLIPAWQCRDYELWEDLDATGRRIDILRRLVDPWCAVEPSRVDVFVDGNVVYLRQRVAFPATADYVLQYQAAAAAPHIRCLNVNVRKTRLPLIGELTLLGRAEAGQTGSSFDPGPGSNVPSTSVEVIPFTREVAEDGGVTFTPGTATQVAAARSYDKSGRLVARVETASTYQIPNQVLLRTQKDTYALVGGDEKQTKREVKTIDYQPFTYDAKGPTNSPMPTYEFAAVYSWVRELAMGTTEMMEVSVFKQNKEETTSYAYDRDNYLTTAATETKEEKDKALVPTKLLVKSYQDTGPQAYTIQTDRYTYVEGALPGTWDLILTQSDLTPATGHRPGGPNRPATKPMNSDMAGLITIPRAQQATLSTDPKAKGTSAGSPHMSEADLAFIAAQHAEASGLVECELSLTALSMPWIRRGSIIEITGVTNQDGDPVSLGKALVYQLDLSYDEAGRRSTSEIRAVWYEAAA